MFALFIDIKMYVDKIYCDRFEILYQLFSVAEAQRFERRKCYCHVKAGIGHPFASHAKMPKYKCASAGAPSSPNKPP